MSPVTLIVCATSGVTVIGVASSTSPASIVGTKTSSPPPSTTTVSVIVVSGIATITEESKLR